MKFSKLPPGFHPWAFIVILEAIPRSDPDDPVIHAALPLRRIAYIGSRFLLCSSATADAWHIKAEKNTRSVSSCDIYG